MAAKGRGVKSEDAATGGKARGKPNMPDFNGTENLAVACAGLASAGAGADRDGADLVADANKLYPQKVLEMAQIHGWPAGITHKTEDGVVNWTAKLSGQLRPGITNVWCGPGGPAP
jgi:hypothetical protein